MTKNLTQQRISFSNKFARFIWGIVWIMLFRPSPRPFHLWRVVLLKIFGAKLGKGVHVYPSAKIWAPWNLEMGDYSCLSEKVDCYSVASIRIGRYSTVSQYSFLCSASHDYTLSAMPLVSAPIRIGNHVWVTADVFVGPGVSIGDGTVVTARSSVFADLPAWVVARGNPAAAIKSRTFIEVNQLSVIP